MPTPSFLVCVTTADRRRRRTTLDDLRCNAKVRFKRWFLGRKSGLVLRYTPVSLISLAIQCATQRLLSDRYTLTSTNLRVHARRSKSLPPTHSDREEARHLSNTKLYKQCSCTNRNLLWIKYLQHILEFLCNKERKIIRRYSGVSYTRNPRVEPVQ